MGTATRLKTKSIPQIRQHLNGSANIAERRSGDMNKNQLHGMTDMALKTIIVRKRDGTTEEIVVCYGAFVGNVFPDGSVVEEVKE